MKLQIEVNSLDELKTFAESLFAGVCGKVPGVPSGEGFVSDKTPKTSAVPVSPTAPVTQAQPAASAPYGNQAVPTAPTVPNVPTAPTSPNVSVVPVAQQTYVLDDLSRAGMTLMDSGRQADLQQLLVRFGVSSLPELPTDQYGAFATALRGLGAQI